MNSFHIITQRTFFQSGATRSFEFRIEQLKKLRTLIKKYEPEILICLKKDLFKSEMEAYGSELLLIYDELDYAIKNLKNWMRSLKIPTPFPLLWPGKSHIQFEPYGSVLIIAPWNYPFVLTFSPLIGAISAGNCMVIKPSEIAPHSQKLIIEILNHFSPEYISPIAGGPDEAKALLKEKFDYIFFTGGTRIGKVVMEAATQHLTPLTLELSGKSPCIVDAETNLDFAARRIVWGKTLNAGQTCIAPDFLYVERSCKDIFVQKLKAAINQFYGSNPELSNSYGRIVNEQHFVRLTKLLHQSNLIHGGNTNNSTKYIEPTLLDVESWDEGIMQEEIFSPLLPILTYEHIDEVIKTLHTKPKPLALYLFSNNINLQKSVLTNLSFGNGCINDCLLQIANYHLPFGGVGISGFGSYHGKHSFELFSHRKSIYKKSLPLDLNLQYPPYTSKKLWWLKQILRLGKF